MEIPSHGPSVVGKICTNLALKLKILRRIKGFFVFLDEFAIRMGVY